MRAKLFTLRYSSTLGGFDSDAVDAFCARHDVLSFREHFFTLGEVPHLACIVQYQPLPVASQPAAVAAPEPGVDAREGGPRGGWRLQYDGLAETERNRFALLREWRNALAREEGVPPYVVLTNSQVIAIAQRDPTSPAELGQIPGLGPSKLRRYGSAILHTLGHPVAAPRSADAQSAEAGAVDTASEHEAGAAL